MRPSRKGRCQMAADRAALLSCAQSFLATPRTAASRRRRSSLRLFELEQLARREVEHAGDDDIGELLDAHVVDVHALVVELAAVGDGVLERR